MATDDVTNAGRDRSTLDLRQLRYFVAVAEERHFGRAAARLRIAQPGLSQQIKRLERSMGVPLFIRDKRTVELTPAGEVLLPQARLVLELAERATQSARAVSRGKSGLLKIGAYALGIYPAATRLLDEFAVRFPHVDIQFSPGHARQSLDALSRHAIDVAILFEPFERTVETRYQRLDSVEAVVALPAGHHLAPLGRIPRSALLRETFLTWPRNLNPPLVDHMRATFFGAETHDDLVEVAELTETLVRVAKGEGITIVNPSVLALESTNLVFRHLENPRAEFEYGLVWREPSASPFVADLLALGAELSARANAADTAPT